MTAKAWRDEVRRLLESGREADLRAAADEVGRSAEAELAEWESLLEGAGR